MSVDKGKRLFGREAELARLENARQSVLDGNGRTLLVSGDPGIGKSALVDHFGDRLKNQAGASFPATALRASSHRRVGCGFIY